MGKLAYPTAQILFYARPLAPLPLHFTRNIIFMFAPHSIADGYAVLCTRLSTAPVNTHAQADALAREFRGTYCKLPALGTLETEKHLMRAAVLCDSVELFHCVQYLPPTALIMLLRKACDPAQRVRPDIQTTRVADAWIEKLSLRRSGSVLGAVEVLRCIAVSRNMVWIRTAFKACTLACKFKFCLELVHAYGCIVDVMGDGGKAWEPVFAQHPRATQDVFYLFLFRVPMGAAYADVWDRCKRPKASSLPPMLPHRRIVEYMVCPDGLSGLFGATLFMDIFLGERDRGAAQVLIRNTLCSNITAVTCLHRALPHAFARSCALGSGRSIASTLLHLCLVAEDARAARAHDVLNYLFSNTLVSTASMRTEMTYMTPSRRTTTEQYLRYEGSLRSHWIEACVSAGSR